MTEDLIEETGPESIMYVNSSKLLDFLMTSEKNKLPQVIVSGGSDHNFSTWELEVLRQYEAVTFFLQNLDIQESEGIRPLPIGVEDLQWARNGMPWNFRSRYLSANKIEKILVGPFAASNPARNECIEHAIYSGACHLELARMPNWHYSNFASHFLFVACPRGNGIDTHRFWETIYRGSIPVVVDSPWARNFERRGVPVLIVDSWANLRTLSLQDASKSISRMDTDVLSPSSWKAEFREIISKDR